MLNLQLTAGGAVDICQPMSKQVNADNLGNGGPPSLPVEGKGQSNQLVPAIAHARNGLVRADIVSSPVFFVDSSAHLCS